MRKQSQVLLALSIEFNSLKSELFGHDLFVVMDESLPSVKRYTELSRLFCAGDMTVLEREMEKAA